jgi:hypothetical protein
MEEVLEKGEHSNQPINTSDKVLLKYLGMENEVWINSKDNPATKWLQKQTKRNWI